MDFNGVDFKENVIFCGGAFKVALLCAVKVSQDRDVE
jgi:hypothetical protein